uniref:BTB domain-containing protein n=1 Tax=Steinernema glaseri TaxID=37863 RepID=A0A1I7ZKR5_9BILA
MEGSTEFNIMFRPMDLSDTYRTVGGKKNFAGHNYLLRLGRKDCKVAVLVNLTDDPTYLLHHGRYTYTITIANEDGEVKHTAKGSDVPGFSIFAFHTTVCLPGMFADLNEEWFHLRLQVKVDDLHVYALSSPIPHFAENPIQVNDKQIYVSKAILSAQSPFFAALFSSGEKVQIQVDELDFVALLHFLYGIPVCLKLYFQGMPHLLELVDRFQCSITKLLIEEKLLECRPSDLKKFLKEIDQCGMKRVAKKIVYSFTGKELRNLKAKMLDITGALSKPTSEAIIERLLSMMSY